MANKNGLGQIIKNMTKATIYRVMAIKYGQYIFNPLKNINLKCIHDYVYIFKELTKKIKSAVNSRIVIGCNPDFLPML